MSLTDFMPCGMTWGIATGQAGADRPSCRAIVKDILRHPIRVVNVLVSALAIAPV